jgi:cysteine desulfurase
MSVYLDCNATAPVRPQAAEAVARALAAGGNASSVHRAGRGARAAIETARQQVAGLVEGSASRVIFTSGGTEANALAIESAVAAGSRRLLISAAEHDCVRQTATGLGSRGRVVAGGRRGPRQSALDDGPAGALGHRRWPALRGPDAGQQ